jgi:hypothetical protein
MTKTIILGEQKDKAIKKPIEFLTHIHLIDCDNVSVENVETLPCKWNYIELICKDYAPNLDLMFAYDHADDRGNGILIIGRWNDGVVE